MSMLSDGTVKVYSRQFFAASFDPENEEAVRSAYAELESSSPATLGELEDWVLKWEELKLLTGDAQSRARIAADKDTRDEAARTRYLRISERITPLIEDGNFRLARKLLADPRSAKLEPLYYRCYLRGLHADARLFREANVPLKARERALVNEYQRITGSLTVDFRGEELTLAQLGRFVADPDPATRREAFLARGRKRLESAGELDRLFDELFGLRQLIARNAGFENFRDYQFVAYHRFDYSPENCFEFHRSVERRFVPLLNELHARRREALGMQSLRPWDIDADPTARPALRPFRDGKELIEACGRIFGRMDAELAAYYAHMVRNGHLDVESRKGKAGGAYMCPLPETREATVFMNAAGVRRDVETMLHECGHAFHYFLARSHRLSGYHFPGMEFAEVASMSMELLARPFLDELYSGADIDRAHAEQLENILAFMPFVAMLDAFQHWAYTQPGTPGAEARRAKWVELESRFRPSLDWSGDPELESIRDIGWQYLHVYCVPFYYIEYGIAQLGALTLWNQSRTDPSGALARYRRALALGGSRALPELFEAIGARLAMSEDYVAPLAEAVRKEISPR